MEGPADGWVFLPFGKARCLFSGRLGDGSRLAVDCLPVPGTDSQALCLVEECGVGWDSWAWHSSDLSERNTVCFFAQSTTCRNAACYRIKGPRHKIWGYCLLCHRMLSDPDSHHTLALAVISSMKIGHWIGWWSLLCVAALLAWWLGHIWWSGVSFHFFFLLSLTKPPLFFVLL